MNVVVGGVGDWTYGAFHGRVIYHRLPRTWRFVSTPRALQAAVKRLKPRWVFLLHWRWKVPPEVLATSEVVGFHMTPLPWGRGGAPLQNLILRGRTSTKLTAFRLTDEMDAGPIYLQRPLTLQGRAGDIYKVAATMAMKMAWDITGCDPDCPCEPRPQRAPRPSDPVFRRRKPEDSELRYGMNARQLYDAIRMVDADGYPHAYCDRGLWRLEFTDAVLKHGSRTVEARVRFTRRRKGD